MSSSTSGRRRKPVPSVAAEAEALSNSSNLINSVLSGGGEMGALMRAFDWSKSSLGPVSRWPQSLRIAVRILLGTGYPMLICWGSQYTMIYNDGYRPILGKTKHPGALGSPIRKVFSEAMDFIGPRFDAVMAKGQDFTVTDQLFILDRNDYVEECYFTFSYSPAPADDGSVGGVLVTALETTEQVLDDRRRRTLRDLAAEMAKTQTEQEVWEAAATALVSEPLTVPFATLYAYQGGERRANLAAAAGGTCSAMCPATAELGSSGVWPFDPSENREVDMPVNDLATRFPDIPATSWGVPPNKAVVLPINLREHRDPAGFLVAGISPRRELDESYRQFLQRAAEQIATGIASARTYDQERRRAEALAELDRAKTLFFSNVSHEFRTPLTLMLGPLEELATKGASRLGAEEQQQVDVARRNALRLLKLVNTLLDFSRIEAGRVQAVYEPADIGALTVEIASVFRSAVEKAGLRFNVECETLTKPVYVDREMWEKIVLNLLSNAFKFTFEGEITVTLKAADGSVELAVRDTGVGIAEEERARVFERFHRVENARARTYEGTGIGLALVQELVKLHGGKLRLESSLGHGSTFTVSLPFGTSHLPADRITAARTLTSTALSADAYVDEALHWLPQASGTDSDAAIISVLASTSSVPEVVSTATKDLIVIADDNADMREYLVHLLGDQYQVHAASDGAQAVEAVRERHPALLVADVMMPGLDGFGVLRAIRSDEQVRDTPVILLSARAGEESRVEGLQAGADDYLVKPFTARELIARVSAHIKMAKQRREAADREARLRAEADLERRRLQDLLAQAPAAIGLMAGPEHRWVYVNEYYVRVTGRSSTSDFVGKTVRESLPEIETQPFIDLLDEVYRSGKPYFGREMKARLNRAATGQPEEAYFDFVYQPISNTEGKVEGILVHAVEVTDKILARNVIRESAERLRLAQTAAQIGTWEWDPIRDTSKLSDELHRLFGTEATDPNHAEKWAARVHPADWAKVQQCMAEGHRSGEMDFEYRYQHPEFGLRWFYCKGRRSNDETRMFGIIQDITARKQAEEALRESEERFRAIVETTPECVKLVAADGTLLQMNSAGLEMIGADWAEIAVGRNIYDVIAPEDRERFREFNERICRGERGSLEFDIISLKGVRRHMETHAAPLRSPDSSLVQLAVTRDVTERRRAEQALQQSEKKYRELAESATIALHWVGPDGIILWANRAELDMLGYSAKEYIGRNIAEFHVDAPVIDDILTRLCRGDKLREYEARLRAKDGSVRHVLIDSSVLFENGKFIHTRCFTRDITERKLAEQALRESEQRLRVVTDATPIMIWMSGTDKLCYYFNKSWLDFVGRTIEQEMGNGWAENVHPDDFDRCLQIYVTSFDARQPFEMEYRLRHRSGQYRWILDHGVPRYAPDGTFEGYVGGCLDIHDQKEGAEKVRIAGEAVLRNKELLDIALAASETGTFRWNPHTGEFLEFDGNLRKLFGFAPDEPVRVTEDFVGRVHPDDLPRLIPAVNACRAGADFDMEYRVLMPDGSIRWLYDRAKMQWENGQPTYLVGACTDITSRKTAEEALRQSEEQFRALANAMPQLVWMANPDGWIFWYNQRWYEYTGTTPEQMEGWGWQSVHDPAVLPSVLQRWKSSIATGQPFEMTFPLRGRDTSYHPFLTRVVPVRDREGSLVRWFGTNTDVSSEVRIQERLQTALAASQRLAAIVESSYDAIVSKDLNGLITSWNRQAERLFGYTEKEMVGRPMLTIIPPELHRDEDMILSKIRSGQKIDHFETVRMTKSGERIEVSLSVSAVRDEQGNIVGAANITRDIRESKNIERTLRITEKLAAAGRLAATVAHEINNPLAAVTNLVYLAKRDLPPGADRVASHLNSAKKELDRVAHIAKQTLGFYRDTSSPVRLNIAQTLDDLLTLYERRLETRNIRILKKYDSSAELTALAGEIRQALSNLLSNSMDAMSAGGTLCVRVSKTHQWSNAQGPGVRITIADSGSGIAPEHRRNLFQPFFTTKSDVGTGLGLWITHSIVEKHGGTIQVRSKTGDKDHGTTFSIFLPLKTSITAEPSAMKPAGGGVLVGAPVQ